MKQDLERYRDTLTKCDIFRGIDGDRLIEMLEAMSARVLTYARGGTIYRTGDEVREPALVLEGTVIVEDSDAEGDDTNLNMLHKGDEFGALLVVSGSARSPMHIYAGTRCEIMMIDLRRLATDQNRSDEMWQLSNNLMVSFAQKGVDLYQKVRIYGKRRIRSRVRLYLMGLEPEGDTVTLPMNRTALAEYLGVDRTALAREFSRMQQEGLIAVDKRRVRLLSPEFFQLSGKTSINTGP